MGDYICKSCEHYLVCIHAEKTRTSCSMYLELVRCKDCKFALEYSQELVCTKPINWRSVEPNHFCSYGERKDNG